MRPLRIEFEAFGAYPSTVDVDFAKLAGRGLFVVTGDTGTGKSTIFDAISFALYGTMPMKKDYEIRSQHASADQQTWVRFTFEIGGETYVAERSPAYERPKKLGAGTTTEAAGGSLVRIEADGATTALATRVSDVRPACQKLLGLSAEHFHRVMLLPQGEISKFLLDDSKDREELLSQLFGGALYERIVDALERDFRARKTEVDAAEEIMRRHLANARQTIDQLHGHLAVALPEDFVELGRGDLDALLKLTEPAAKVLERRAGDSMVLAAKVEQESSLAEESAARFDRAAELRSTIAELEKHRPEAEAAAKAARGSRLARPVVHAADKATQANAHAREATEKRSRRSQKITELAASLGAVIDTGSTTKVTSGVSALREEIESEEMLLTDLDGANGRLHGCRELLDQNQIDYERELQDALTLRARIDEVDALLVDLDPQRNNLNDIDAAHTELEGGVEFAERRDQLDRALEGAVATVDVAAVDYESMWKQFIETEASRLAAQVDEGEPCPVCGSQDHPALAVDEAREPVDYSKVEKAKANRDGAVERREQLQRKLSEVRAELGSLAEASVDSLVLQIVANRVLYSAAVEFEARSQKLIDDRIDCEGKIEEVNRRVARFEGARIPLKAALKTAETEHNKAEMAAYRIDAENLGYRRTVLDELFESQQGLEDLFSVVTSTRATSEAASKTVDEQLEASNFSSIDAARMALLDEKEEASAINADDDLKTNYQEAVAKRDELSKQGVPGERPDVEGLEKRARAARSEAAQVTELRIKAEGAAERAATELAAHGERDSGSSDIRRMAEIARLAYTVCKGQGTVKISLRRWVLGRELERVARAASVHFSDMTAGRYTIRRRAEATNRRVAAGLDLELLDAHTGRARSARSLSGGEQFQASLALALGLADVVSQGGSGSGHRIEALFIDEGFGTLDPDALDQAIETLYQLQTGGRMVGVITHVEAMKQRLHAGITVTRLAGGKGSTLTVNP